MSDWISYARAIEAANSKLGEGQGAASVIRLIADGALSARAYRLKETNLAFGPDDFQECQKAIEASDPLDAFFPPFGGKGEIGTLSRNVPFSGHHVLRFRSAVDGEWTRLDEPRKNWRQEVHLDLNTSVFRFRGLIFVENYGFDDCGDAYLWSAHDWFGLEVELDGFEKLLTKLPSQEEPNQTPKDFQGRKGGRRGAQHGEAIAQATMMVAGLSSNEMRRYTAQSLALELADIYLKIGEQPPSAENLERYAQGILRVVRI